MFGSIRQCCAFRRMSVLRTTYLLKQSDRRSHWSAGIEGGGRTSICSLWGLARDGLEKEGYGAHPLPGVTCVTLSHDSSCEDRIPASCPTVGRARKSQM